MSRTIGSRGRPSWWSMLWVIGIPMLLLCLPLVQHVLQWPWMLVDWLAGKIAPWYYPHQDSWYFFWLWGGVAAVSVACLCAAWRERDLTPTFGLPLSVLTAVFALMLWAPDNPEGSTRKRMAEQARLEQANDEARIREAGKAAEAAASGQAWRNERPGQLARAHRAAEALAAGNLAIFRVEHSDMVYRAERHRVDGMAFPGYRAAAQQLAQLRPQPSAPLQQTLERRRLLMQAIDATTERAHEAVAALLPIEYSLAIDPDAQLRATDNALASAAGTPQASLETSRRLAESRLLLDPMHFGSWYGWAMLQDPVEDEARVRGALIAAYMLERPDDPRDIEDRLKLGVLSFGKDRARLQALQKQAQREVAVLAPDRPMAGHEDAQDVPDEAVVVPPSPPSSPRAE